MTKYSEITFSSFYRYNILINNIIIIKIFKEISDTSINRYLCVYMCISYVCLYILIKIKN